MHAGNERSSNRPPSPVAAYPSIEHFADGGSRSFAPRALGADPSERSRTFPRGNARKGKTKYGGERDGKVQQPPWTVPVRGRDNP